MTNPISPIERLRIQSTSISCEALSIQLPNRALLKKLTGYIGDVKDYLTATLRNLSAPPDAVDFRPFLAAIKNKDYLTLAPTQLPVPPGFSATWLDYCDALSQAQDYAKRLVPEILVPFERYLSQIVNDPDTLADQSYSFPARFHNLETSRAAIANCFQNGQKAEQPYGALVQRNADVAVVAVKFNALLKEDVQMHPKTIGEMVSRNAQLIDTIMAGLADPNSNYHPNPRSVDRLSKDCFAVAKEVEFFSVLHTQLLVLSVSLKDAVQKMAKA